jgi:hypothetical protein
MSEQQVINFEDLKNWSTEALKKELLSLPPERDREPFNKKIQFYQNHLAPIFEELSKRNPNPNLQEQASLVLGIWSPLWSTIPFQDIIPGRIREQSYQIFHDNGYYANIARYGAGSDRTFVQKLTSIWLAYDLMILQKYAVESDRWVIENIGIKQAVKFGASPLTKEKAEKWFTEVVQSQQQLSSQENDSSQVEFNNDFDRKVAKQLKGTYQATPQFEHLYIDRDFRLVKTQREAKQRPSYTIAVRKA